MWGWLWSDLRYPWQQVSEPHPFHSFYWISFCLFPSTLNASSRYCGRPDGGRSALFRPVCQSSSVGGQQKLLQGLHGASRHPHGPLRLLHRPPGGLQLHPHVSTVDRRKARIIGGVYLCRSTLIKKDVQVHRI